VKEEKLEFPPWFNKVVLPFPELITKLYAHINEKYGTNFSPPF
jgi:hypothetical protein